VKLFKSNTKRKGDKYEHKVARKMWLHGYFFVRVVGHSSDYGCDVIARYFPFGRIVVQCKNYKGKVGVQAVQEIYAAKRYYHATRAAVATNSTFTKNAEKLAAACGVELWARY
jgi:restriction system protein